MTDSLSPSLVPGAAGGDAAATPSRWNSARIGRWVLVLAILLGGMRLYTINNDFLFFYHPDESGKVKQVMSGNRNFRHPLLLLTTSTFLMHAGGFPHENQAAVRAGRLASALFTTLTVALAALLAWELCGDVWGAVATVLALGLARDPFEYAHYMKEDPALVLGVLATLFTARQAIARCTPANLAWLGLGTALALSGKYLGVIMLAVSLPVVIWAGKGEMPAARRWAWFGGALVVALLIFNYNLLNHPKGIHNALTREVGIATHGHRGLPHPIPHAYYLDLMARQMPPLIYGLAAAYLVLLAAQWRSRRRGEWLVPATALVFTIIISCSPIVSRRYCLPVWVLLSMLAGLGAWRIAALLARLAPAGLARRAVVAVVILGFGAGLYHVSSPTLRDLARSFGQDDHVALTEWVRANLPADAVIAQDDRVNIPHPGRWEYEGLPEVPQKVVAKEFVSDLGSLDAMIKQGIQYVAVCQQTYDRFFDDSLKPQPEKADWYAKNKAFYAGLFTRGEKVWSMPKGTIIYLEPGLAIYRIAPAKPAPAP